MGTVHELTITRTSQRPVVAILAHKSKESELVDVLTKLRRALPHVRLLSGDRIAAAIECALGTQVERIPAEPGGDDMQIAARIVQDAVDAVVFFREPLGIEEPDVGLLLKLCDLHCVPLATNAASARILLDHLAAQDRSSVRISHPSSFPPGRFPWDPPKRTFGPRRR